MSHEEENPMSDARSLTMSHAQSLSMSRALRDAMMRDYHKRMPSSLFTILKALPGSDHDRALWGLMELGQPVRHLGNSYRVFDRRFNADKSLVEYELILLPLVNQEKGLSLPSVSGEPRAASSSLDASAGGPASGPGETAAPVCRDRGSIQVSWGSELEKRDADRS
jgi:hypothetical protein